MPRLDLPADRPVGRLLLVGLAALLTLVLSGCRMHVDTRVEVTAAGSGTLALVIDLDDELFESLTATGFDPTPEAVPGWEVERVATEDGEQVRVTTSFDDPGQLAERIVDLDEGLGDDDPRLVESIDLVVGSDGTTSMEAVVGVRLPSSTGVEGPGFAGADELAALVADPDNFTATFTVALPGPVAEHNADIVRGATAVWQLPPGEAVNARVTSDPPALVGGWVLTAAGIGLLAGVVLLGTWLLRRRRRERREAPFGRVSR